MKTDSDLGIVPFALGLILAVLVVFALFFFVGAFVGVIALIGFVVLGLVLAARFVRKNDLS